MNKTRKNLNLINGTALHLRTIEEAIRRIKEGTITEYEYDTGAASIVKA